MVRKIFFLSFLFIVCDCFSQNDAFSFATKESRENLIIKLKDSIINKEADNYLNSNKINWDSYAWATAFTIDNSSQNYLVLKKALTNYKLLSKPDLQKVFESVFACFPKEFIPEITVIAENENENEKVFACAINYLAQNNIEIQKILKINFKDSNHPILIALRNQFKSAYKQISFLDLKQLIAFNINKNGKYLYSIQHSNRDKIGKVFIQNKNGHLARNNNKVIVIEQLARSATNLPMFITNGNTPVGLFRIDTLAKSENVFIGPTLSFASYLPFECDAKVFFNDEKKDFSLENYLAFFPKEMQQNLSLQQSYWAGKSGRSEIYFHGTTIDQNLYIGKEFYGQTPSMGCLCTKEIWDEAGNLISSDQQKLIDAWMLSSEEKGYAYVLELKESDWESFEKNINKIL